MEQTKKKFQNSKKINKNESRVVNRNVAKIAV